MAVSPPAAWADNARNWSVQPARPTVDCSWRKGKRRFDKGRGIAVIQRLAFVFLLSLIVLAPEGAKAQSSAELIAADVDAYWATQFAERGLAYASPMFRIVDGPGQEICDFIDAYLTPAGYCATNQTITVSTAFVSLEDVATLLPMISHEWGHHVQNLMDTGVTTALEYELQADCFAGAFVGYAQQADWINPVVSTIALQVTQSAGDIPWELGPDAGVHGSGAERAVAFMTGLNGGLSACGI
jgi:predicted metalloprotease